MTNCSTQLKVPVIPQRGATRCGECGEVVTDLPWFLTYYVKKESGKFKIVDLQLNHKAFVNEPRCRDLILDDPIHPTHSIRTKRRGWNMPPVFPCWIDPCMETDLEILEETFNWSKDAKKTLYEMKQHLNENQLFAIPYDIPKFELWNTILEVIIIWIKEVAADEQYLEKVVIERGYCPEYDTLEISRPNCKLIDRVGKHDYIPTSLFRVVRRRGARFILDVLKNETELKNFIQDLHLQKLTVSAEEFLDAQAHSAKLKTKKPTKI